MLPSPSAHTAAPLGWDFLEEGALLYQTDTDCIFFKKNVEGNT